MTEQGRREFLMKAGAAGLGLAAAARVGLGAEPPAQAEAAKPEPVSAPEDLMREHGVIERLMTIYQTCGERLSAGTDLSPGVLLDTGAIVDAFVQAYHEMLEEKHVFPAFQKAGRLTELVAVLLRQHQVGRELSARIIVYAGKGNLLEPETKSALVTICQSYTRMYRAHMGREDTQIFVGLRDVVPAEEFNRMGDMFEDLETEHLGQDGYETVVQKVAAIERDLGIADLNAFTAKV